MVSTWWRSPTCERNISGPFDKTTQKRERERERERKGEREKKDIPQTEHTVFTITLRKTRIYIPNSSLWNYSTVNLWSDFRFLSGCRLKDLKWNIVLVYVRLFGIRGNLAAGWRGGCGNKLFCCSCGSDPAVQRLRVKCGYRFLKNDWSKNTNVKGIIHPKFKL